MNNTNPNTQFAPIHSAWLIIFLVFALLLSGCTTAGAVLNTLQITIQVDQSQIEVEVPAGTTVQGALQQAQVTLGSLDRIDPPTYSILANNEVIEVTRVQEVFSVLENSIPFERRTINNETLPANTWLMVQKGVNGTEQITYRKIIENNQEVSNKIFKIDVLVEPMPEIVMVGVQKPFTPVTIPGKLAYISSGNAWLMENSTGNRRPIITTGDLDGRVFSLSPKGDWLLFTRSEKKNGESSSEQAEEVGDINSLWAINLSVDNAKPVSLGVKNVIHFAAWVPGKGLTISFSTVEPRATAPGWQANNELQMLTLASSGTVLKRETVVEANAGGVYGWWGTNFSWSPDGKLLAYARPDGVGLVDFDNQNMVPLVDILPFQTGADWAWVPGIAWGGSQYVLYMVTHAPLAGLEPVEISPVFHLSALPITILSTPPETPDTIITFGPLIDIINEVGMFAYPVASPAGGEQSSFSVAYLQSREPRQSENRRYRLALIDRDGSNRRQIFPAEDRQGIDPQRVVWSPAGLANGHQWMAVNYQGNLSLIDAETGAEQPVTGDGLVSIFDWK
jgi:resuscitation-promoting factor RpfB